MRGGFPYGAWDWVVLRMWGRVLRNVPRVRPKAARVLPYNESPDSLGMLIKLRECVEMCGECTQTLPECIQIFAECIQSILNLLNDTADADKIRSVLLK